MVLVARTGAETRMVRIITTLSQYNLIIVSFIHANTVGSSLPNILSLLLLDAPLSCFDVAKNTPTRYNGRFESESLILGKRQTKPRSVGR